MAPRQGNTHSSESRRLSYAYREILKRLLGALSRQDPKIRSAIEDLIISAKDRPVSREDLLKLNSAANAVIQDINSRSLGREEDLLYRLLETLPKRLSEDKELVGLKEKLRDNGHRRNINYYLEECAMLIDKLYWEKAPLYKNGETSSMAAVATNRNQVLGLLEVFFKGIKEQLGIDIMPLPVHAKLQEAVDDELFSAKLGELGIELGRTIEKRTASAINEEKRQLILDNFWQVVEQMPLSSPLRERLSKGKAALAKMEYSVVLKITQNTLTKLYALSHPPEKPVALEPPRKSTQRPTQKIVNAPVTNSPSIIEKPSGVISSKVFYEKIGLELSGSKTRYRTLTFVLMEIDQFEIHLNHHGAEAANKIVGAIASISENYIRTSDLLAYIDTARFGLLLANVDLYQGLSVANKLCSTIKKTAFQYQDKKIRVTVSCGVSQFHKQDSIADVMKRAAICLKHAMKKGKGTCYSENDIVLVNQTT